MTTATYRGRIAPSPTGFLHLGHAKTFWTAFTRCRDAGGTLVYRDEDIDSFRCATEYSSAAIEDLKQLGILWDEGPFRQSDRIALYVEALETLARKGSVYPCPFSRKEITEAPDARISPRGETVFPLSLRPPSEFHTYKAPMDLTFNWRFKVPLGQAINFTDNLQGIQNFVAGSDFGDFLVWRKDGMPSYELAVVVDDAAMGITEVVRGEDLLVSTARQLLLYGALEQDAPEFYHEYLVRDESGERLAKRKDSLALRTLFAQGHYLDSLRELWIKHS
jgi:glutamyl-tRNA synthetase